VPRCEELEVHGLTKSRYQRRRATRITIAEIIDPDRPLDREPR